MKKTTMKFLSVIITLIMLAFLVPQHAAAGGSDIDLTWGRDASIFYHEHLALLQLKIQVYDEAGGDDEVDECAVYIDGGDILWFRNYGLGFKQNESNKKRIRFKTTNWNDRIWIGNTDNGEVRHTDRNWHDYNVWQEGNTGRYYMMVYIYLPDHKFNRNVEVRLRGRAHDYNGTTNFDSTHKFYAKFNPPTLSITDHGYQPDGWYKITVNSIHGLADQSYVRINMLEGFTNRDFVDHGIVYNGKRQGQGDLVLNKEYRINPDPWKEGYTTENWVSGLRFKFQIYYESEEKRHIPTSITYTPEYSAPHMSAFKSDVNGNALRLGQDNRTLTFSWETMNWNDKNNQLPDAPFVIQRSDNGGKNWTDFMEVPFAYDRTKYDVTRTLTDSEINKGNKNVQWRVWRKYFETPGIWHQYFRTNVVSSTLFTDYKKVKALRVEPMTDNTTARVYWHLDNYGIWDNKVKLTLRVHDVEAGTSRDFTPAYDASYAVIDGLQSCKIYNITMNVTVNDSEHQTIAYPEGFQVPDAGARSIHKFEVSKGYFNDYVMLKWEIPGDSSDFKYFNIYRKSIHDEEAVHVAQIQHSGLTKYSYQDKSMDAGEIYTYTIDGFSECFNQPIIGYSVSDYGFSQPYGTVSGRITYEGDVAVAGATVAVVGDNASSSNKSLSFTGSEATSKLEMPSKLLNFRSAHGFTFQAWVRRSAVCGQKDYLIHSNDSLADLYINADSRLCIMHHKQEFVTDFVMPLHEWKQITLSMYAKGTESYIRLYIDGQPVSDFVAQIPSNWTEKTFTIGNTSDGTSGLTGNIDEIRIWSEALSEKDIASNYNSFLNGREAGLSAYYRCDEDGVDFLFDLSGRRGNFNKNDLALGSMVDHSDMVPSADQLANKTTTDRDGNYLISTVPYTSDGVQYNVIPMMGIHKFSPNKRPIYVSPNSVTFNGVDFQDNSSFDVTGVVYYENTLYPVQDCELYVDGVIASRDGKVISTNDKGEFKLSVPIGDHFIEVRKQGHTFAEGGRLPADPRGTGRRMTFEEPLHGLTFYDITKVTVAGRVSGGEIEDQKPLGLKQSKANIGRAVITLKTGYKMNVELKTEGASTSFENATTDLRYDNTTNNITSNVTVGSGDAEQVSVITIVTDSITGEFAAEMPPIEYQVMSVKIPSNPEINIPLDKISNIDATQVLMTYTDSVRTENGVEQFDYNVAKRISYRVDTPSFEVSDNKDGSFGEQFFNFYTLDQPEPDTVAIYDVLDDGSVSYKFGAPVFYQDKFYDFNLFAYERYVNLDGDEPVVDRVPLQNSIVTITNEFAAGQKVYVEGAQDGQFVNPSDLAANQLSLDDNGRAVYNFKAGLPNIVAPHTLGLNINYNVNGVVKQWTGNGTFQAIVLGNMPSANNFITSGPDRVLMILRDPPGSGSSSYFEKGTTITQVNNSGLSYVTTNELTTLSKLGTTNTTITGTPGFAVINEIKSEYELTVGFVLNADVSDNTSVTNTVTTSERISTSDSEDYVGAEGDLFVGSATNLIFGKARIVDIRRVNDDYVVNMEEGYSVGQDFTTGFKYTQSYIESTLIPNLIKTRDNYLQHVSSVDGIVNNTKEPIYVTTLSADDPRFGSNNFDKTIWGNQASTKDSTCGPSYHMILPSVQNPGVIYQDMVRYHNTQVTGWINTLRDNEVSKVTAIRERSKWLAENHSFDAGAIVESSVSNSVDSLDQHTYMAEEFLVGGLASGVKINDTGVAISGRLQHGIREFGNRDSSMTKYITTGYILSEAGYNDALTVDVFNDPDGRGAIFATRGGQTSCPHEDAIVTKYFEPGFEISAATMQVEKPRIRVENPIATDVASGKAANFTLKLDNLSDTEDDIWFDLAVDDYSNKSAAITIDGATITKARPILVRSGQTVTKTLQLRQTRLDELKFNDIRIILRSQCEGDVIADTVSISATFVPSCSDITMEIGQRVINSYTGTVLPITVKDYDRTFDSFRGIRVQYKGSADTQWRLVREYDQSEIDAARLTCKFDMSNNALYPDGEYIFRAITICQFGTEELFSESDLITVIKDVERPQLLGTPSPANGVLTPDGDISVTFNEDIKSSTLSKGANFIVRGRLNGYRVDHSTALAFTGGTGAVSQADIDLSSRSFAFNLWFKATAGRGELLAHGNAANKFVVALDPAGRVSVTYGGHSYLSDNVVPLSRWNFLTLSYDNDANTLSGYVFNDAATVTLFDNVAADKYTGCGVLRIGSDYNGIIHEVTLWDYARSRTEAQSEMYTAKSPKTPNLIGYWRMDEGHGAAAIDFVRNRHLTLGDGTNWYIADANKAVQFRGDAHIELNTSVCTPDSVNDFMLEFWFNAEARQSADATLISTGLGFGLRMNEGRLELQGADGIIPLGTATYNDNTWHHFALNVLRRGVSAAYVDGIMLRQIPSVDIAPLASDRIILGADRVRPDGDANTWQFVRHFSGMVDEFRLWDATLSADFVRNNRFNRIDAASVAGLVAYYPFEKSEVAPSGVVQVSLNFEDHSATASPEAKVEKATMATSAPALKSAPLLTNAEYSFVASERQVFINLEEAPDIVEGATIEFTLREVRDLTDNLSQPIVWTAYVQRNQLRWIETGTDILIQNLAGAQFDATIINRGGTVENWTLSNIPVWLTADVDGGAIDPLTEQTIRFSVSESLPVGSYEETIYLIGNKQIYEPYVVHVEVTGVAPDWDVRAADYENSLNIIGQLQYEGRYTENSNDIIAAFIDGRCVGLASPHYYADYDAYFVHMDLYGNTEDAGSDVRFKVWEASTGTVRPVVRTTEPVRFAANAVIGSLDNPFIWNATEQIEQCIPLNHGWTWISTYVNDASNSVAQVFEPIKDDTRIVKDKTSFASYSTTKGWDGTLVDFKGNKMYKTNTRSAHTLLNVGLPLVPSETTVTIATGWNWIGYNPSFTSTIADAFAGLNPVKDDLVKGQNGFSTYNGYRWIGTLSTLVPGRGYMYQSVSRGTRQFTYPDAPAAQRKTAMKVIRAEAEHFTTVDNSKYPGNMTMIALVMDGDQIVYDSEVGIFAGRECRGAARSSSDDGLLFITIAGDDNGDRLSIKVRTEGETLNVKTDLIYQDDAMHGTLDEPYIIQIGKMPTSVDNSTDEGIDIYVEDGVLHINGAGEYKLYNAAGQLIYNGSATEQILPTGVYMIHIGEETHKVVI